MTVFGVRSTANHESNSLASSVDNQRAMKQLELSNKIQTGLELKIDTMKKEISKLNSASRPARAQRCQMARPIIVQNLCLDKLTDDLHSTQKSSRSYSDQLSDTKKRLRDTQHDLKELEEKYKRYSDALYRVRSESRSTLDQLTHVLGIKEKQPSQARKTDEEAKKAAASVKVETKSSNDNDKKKEAEKSDEQEQITIVEGMSARILLSMDLNAHADAFRK